MSDRVSFICYSRAAPQGSKRHIGGGVLIESSKRVKPFRSDLQGIAIEATPVDWDLGLEYHLRVDFHFRRPKSHLTSKGALTKAAPLFPTGRQIGDTDKLIRSVCDALTGICWYDDSQVVDISAKKRFFSNVRDKRQESSSPSHQSSHTIQCLNSPKHSFSSTRTSTRSTKTPVQTTASSPTSPTCSAPSPQRYSKTISSSFKLFLRTACHYPPSRQRRRDQQRLQSHPE